MAAIIAPSNGEVDLAYDAVGGGRGEALVLTHIAALPLLAYLAWQSGYARTSRDRGRAIAALTHFVPVLAASLSWHVCDSYGTCPLKTQDNSQRADHFTAATSISALLIYGMPTLLDYHRYLLLLLAYTIHALEFAAKPDEFSSARWSMIITFCIYIGSNLQRCADEMAADIEARARVLALERSSSSTPAATVTSSSTGTGAGADADAPAPAPAPMRSVVGGRREDATLVTIDPSTRAPRVVIHDLKPYHRVGTARDMSTHVEARVMYTNAASADRKVRNNNKRPTRGDRRRATRAVTARDIARAAAEADEDVAAQERWSAVGAWKTLGFTDLTVPELFVVIFIAAFANGFYSTPVSRQAGAWKHSIWHVGAFLGALLFVRLTNGSKYVTRGRTLADMVHGRNSPSTTPHEESPPPYHMHERERGRDGGTGR